MRLLLDTCVVSEVARPNGSQQVKDFVSKHAQDDLYLSVITLGEVKKGIASLPKEAVQKKKLYTNFLLALQNNYGSRILPIDLQVAFKWAELVVDAQFRGKTLPAMDGLIAATAAMHDLTVVTRNVADFRESGVDLINPW